MISTSLQTLRSSTKTIYWVLVYSYNDSFVQTPLSKERILLFPFMLYTPYANRTLPAFVSEQPLDLSSDEDLDMILNRYSLKHVQSVSEMVISQNTNLIALEVDRTKEIKGWSKNSSFYYYSAFNPPDYYIGTDEYLENGVKIPNNPRLLLKVNVFLGRFIIKTSVTMKQIISFLFRDYFDNRLEKRESVDPIYRRLLEDQDSEADSDTESEKSRETTDSRLSYYSYCKKYNIKDIQ